MNTEFPTDPRSALEASLTALLLGELPHEQAAALHQKLAQDAELAALYERLKHTINWVRETIASPAEQAAAPLIPLRLEERRRQKLLQQFKTVAPREFARPRRRAMRWLLPVGIAAAFVVILGGLFLPALSKSKGSAQLFSLNRWSVSGGVESAGPAPSTAHSARDYFSSGRDVRGERLALASELRNRVTVVPPPAEFTKRTSEDLGRNGRVERLGSEVQVRRELKFSQPPSEPASAPPKAAGDAIVLPKATELAGATTTSSASPGNEGWFASATSRGFYEDSVGTAGGTGGGGATGGRSGGSARHDTLAAEGRPTEVAGVNYFSSRTAALDASGAGKPVKNQGEIAVLGMPSSPPVVADSAGDTLVLEGEGKLRESAGAGQEVARNKPAFAGRFQYGLQAPAPEDAVAPAAPATISAPVATWLDNSHSKQGDVGIADGAAQGMSRLQMQAALKNSASTAPDSVAGAAEHFVPAAPAAPPPPVRSGLPMDSLYAGAAPAPAPAEARPVPVEKGLEVARVPLQTHGEEAEGVVAGGRAAAPSRPPTEVRRGAEVLIERAAIESRPATVTAGTPSAFGGGGYGGYSATPQAADGAKVMAGPPRDRMMRYSDTPQAADGAKGQVPNVGDVPLPGLLFRSHVKDRAKSQGEGQVPNPQETAVNEAVLRQAAVQLQPQQITSGLRAPEAPLSARGRVAPAKAGQPLPEGKIGDQPSAEVAFAWSDARKKASDAPVVGYNVHALTDQNAAKEPERRVTLQGITTPGKPASEMNYALFANGAAAKGPATPDSDVSSAGSAKLGWQWGADGNQLPGPANSDGDGVPVLGDVATARRFYRVKGDEVGGGDKAKVEEKFKSMDFSFNTDLGRQTNVAEGESSHRESVGVYELANAEPADVAAAVQDLFQRKAVAGGAHSTGAVAGGGPHNLDKGAYTANVVGYVNLPASATNFVTLAPAESATRDRLTIYAFGSQLGAENKEAQQNQRSPIVLPSAQAGTTLALKGSSSAEQKIRPYFEAKASLEELQRFRQILDAKIAYEKIDVDLPKTRMVEIVDKAVPQSEGGPTLGERIRSGLGAKVERHARVKVERDQSDIAALGDRQPATGYDPYFIQTEFEAIQSEPVLGKVIKDLNLNEAWGKKQGGKTLTTAETMALLKKNLDLVPEKNGNLIDVGVKSEQPEEAARIANAVAEAYAAHRAEQRAQLSKGGIKALEERFAEQEQKVREAQKRVDDLRASLNISDAMASGEGPSPLMTADTLRKLESLRIESKAEYVRQATLSERLKNLEKQVGPEGLAQAITTAAPDSLLSSLLEQQTVAEQKLATLAKNYGPEHPEVIKAKSQAEDLHAQVKNRVDGIMLGLDAKLLSLSNSVDNLQKEVAKADQSDINRANQGQAADVAPPKPAAPAPVPQPEVQTGENAFSTFSLNVSDVSYKLAAASLEKGVMPEPASVRSEEFINALDYRDPEPPPGVPVAFAWERAQYPFAQNRDLLRFSIKTAALGRQPGRPLNLVLLLDNSGSMERADRVSIIREALRVLGGQLQPQDKFSIVTFSRTAHLWVDGVPGNQAAKAAEEVSGLTPQGGTNLEDAMNLAYQTALRHYLANGVNRVVLLTDGAANLGNVDPEALKQKVEANRKQGIALDCFGIGWEGYNDDLLEVLSRNGDGRYGFVNTPEEAATEFAGQFAGALHVAASDVKVQVEFNPARVTAYRQIGYAKHQLTKEQFRDNTVDAAEIGAAESGNALYVVAVNPGGEGPLATVRVRYKVPGTTDYHEHEWPVPYTGNAVALEQASPAMRLAATASAFSEWLVSSPYAAEVTPDRLLAYLSGVPQVYGADARPTKLEWMLRQAKSIAGK